MSQHQFGEIEELQQQMESEDDPRSCYAMVKDRIRKYRDAGKAVPEDLELLERQLMVDCLAASQGR